MLYYALGVVLFALAILISLGLHEAGHMGTAKMFGMRVTRYFIGFGPTIWSFKKGETEYGFKWLPFGGFVKISGMTEQEEQEEPVPPGQEHRIFWRKPLWQRTVVLAAGSVTHFILGFVILWILVSFVSAPNPEYIDEMNGSTQVTVSECLKAEPPQNEQEAKCTDADEPSPAAEAGLQDGDKIIAVAGTPVSGEKCDTPGAPAGSEPSMWACVVNQVRDLPGDEASVVTVERDGAEKDLEVTPRSVSVETPEGTQKVNQVGIGLMEPSVPRTVTHGAVDGVGVAVTTTGDMAVAMGEAITRIPEKVPALWNSIFGAERDPETPVSVVGASRLGGEMVANDAWVMFFSLLVTLNYFIGLFNLAPLLPMDGGHIAIAWFEKVRSWWARRRNRPDPGRVDYMKLMPLTYVVLIVLVGFTLLTVTADIINPITLFN